MCHSVLDEVAVLRAMPHSQFEQENHVRYVVAAVGACFLFVACTAAGLILTAFPALQGTLYVPLLLATLSIRNPVWLIGPALGILAGIHSYRSTLKRYEAKAEKKTHA